MLVLPRKAGNTVERHGAEREYVNDSAAPSTRLAFGTKDEKRVAEARIFRTSWTTEGIICRSIAQDSRFGAWRDA